MIVRTIAGRSVAGPMLVGVMVMVFQLSFAVVGRLLAFCQAWMPSNHLVRWLDTDRGLKWGVPVAVVLVPLYMTVGDAARAHLDAGGSTWWAVPFIWATIGALKFLSVGVRTPFVWAWRTARRRLLRWRERPARTEAW